MRKFILYSIMSVFIFFNIFLIKNVYGATDNDLEGFLGDLFGSLNTDSSFGFNDTDQIIFSNKKDTSIDVTFPVVSEGTQKIDKYNIWGSNISMESDNGLDYDSSSVINQTFENIDTSKPTTTVTLTGLKKGITYYITISPINKDGINGNISKEVSFSLDTTSNPSTSSNTTNDTLNNTTNNNTTNTTTHSSANPNMNLANLSYTQNNKNLTLTWTPLDGADEVEISYRKIGENDMKVAGKTNMSNGRYTFSLPDIDTYVLKLQPLKNGTLVGTEIHQTIHMVKDSSISQPNTNPLPNPSSYPTTGPKENIIAIILGTLFIYSLYKLSKKV